MAHKLIDHISKTSELEEILDEADAEEEVKQEQNQDIEVVLRIPPPEVDTKEVRNLVDMLKLRNALMANLKGLKDERQWELTDHITNTANYPLLAGLVGIFPGLVYSVFSYPSEKGIFLGIMVAVTGAIAGLKTGDYLRKNPKSQALDELEKDMEEVAHNQLDLDLGIIEKYETEARDDDLILGIDYYGKIRMGRGTEESSFLAYSVMAPGQELSEDDIVTMTSKVGGKDKSLQMNSPVAIYDSNNKLIYSGFIRRGVVEIQVHKGNNTESVECYEFKQLEKEEIKIRLLKPVLKEVEGSNKGTNYRIDLTKTEEQRPKKD
jgi:hypothetical protein